MMLAMCVRKTGDTGGTPTMQGGLTSSTSSITKRKHKPLKALRGRGGGSTKHQDITDKRQSGTVEVECTVKVRDDAEGHLIYHKGDLIDSRCKLKFWRLGLTTSRPASAQWTVYLLLCNIHGVQ